MYTAPMSSRPSLSQQKAVWSPAFFAWCFVFLLAAMAISELKPPDAMPAASPENEFSAERALIHVRAIARVPHPIGSEANAAARDYLIAQLSGLGMNPQVVTAIGVNTRSRSGALVAGRTHDIVARLPGVASSGAILLMAHYDSVPSGPGAADDACGVATLLEALRALKTGAPLRNDVIVLFTDGEEAGLLGAEAFVASDPWIKDVGLAMNFEARGDRGPSLLFETSGNNASLINEVRHVAPYPIGSSLFYALYKLLPNDTDFTVLRPAGVPGLNFAFGGRLEAYHSLLDTADNLDTKSLQHQGSYALTLVRDFGELNLSRFREKRGDAIFFDWFGANLIAYGERWVMRGEFAVSILLAVAIAFSLRRREIRIARLAAAVPACLSILLVLPIGMSATGWLVLWLLRRNMLLGDTPANSLLLISLILLGVVLGGGLLEKLRAYFSLQELSLGGLVLVCILSWIVALLLPAGSFLLFWPLLLTILGLVTIGLAGTKSSRAWLLGTLAGAVMTILLFAPIADLLYIFLTLNVLSIAAVGLLLGLFFVICIPLMNVAVPQDSARRIAVPMLAAAAVCLGAGILQSHSSAQHPRRDTLVYSLNAGDHAAVWVSYDNAVDSYTAQFISGNANPQSNPDYLTGSPRLVLSGVAPVVELLPPISEINADEQNGGLRNIRMKVRSQREANLITLRFDPSVKISALRVSGRSMSLPTNSSGPILLYGMGTQGADLEFTLHAPPAVSFWISDQSAGLPTAQHRPSDLIPGQASDMTLVCRKYTLNRPTK
jgi:hypothetical protein